MSRLTVVFTRRRWNPVSWLIRWAMPRSRFSFALSSHAILVDGDDCYEATMLHGVRKVARAVALKNQIIVKETHYSVPDAAAGIQWAAGQVGTPYDFRGAFGLAFAPGRDWAQEDCWFCYEFVAAVLRSAGRPVFANLSHVGETALMAINP
ncbi:MAG: hypothetical protein ACXW2U_08955 [Telluria sp.]